MAKNPVQDQVPLEHSWSQLDMNIRCGYQWFRRYVLKERLPPGIAACRGSALHMAAQTSFRAKLTSGNDLPANILEEMAVSAFEDRVKEEGVWLNPSDEANRGEDIVVAEAKDELPKFIGPMTEYLARVWPTRVEEAAAIALTVPLANGNSRLVRVQARIDVSGKFNPEAELHDPAEAAAIADGIADLKTGARKKGQETVDSDDQLTLYGQVGISNGWFNGTIEEVPLGMATVTPKVLEFLKTRRTPAHVNALLARIQASVRAIEAGVVVPAPRSAWWCSRKWCGWYDKCPYVAG